MRQTDVVELIEDVAAVRASHATTSGHEIHATVRGPLIVRCSADDLRMALDCLVDNALKHTPSGSHIWMAADDLGSECALSVTDDGPGISAENRERAFRRFERLGRTDHEGSGLGLAIVRRVAELHGGRVLLQAREDGRGCRFEIRIPLET